MVDPQPRQGGAAPLVRCLITALILLFIAVSIGSLMAWLILHPRVPVFHLKSLSVSNLTLLDTNLTAEYKMAFVVKNPNRKINLQFFNLDVSIAYKKCEVSRTSVPSFVLQKMGQVEKLLELETNKSKRAVSGRHHVEEMRRDLSRKQVVYDVRMSGEAAFRAGKWFCRNRLTQVVCKNLTVVFSDKYGELSNGGADCYSCTTSFGS